MTEQPTPEQLLRSALELARADLEASYAHNQTRLRQATGEAWHEAHRASADIVSAKRLIENLLAPKEDSR